MAEEIIGEWDGFRLNADAYFAWNPVDGRLSFNPARLATPTGKASFLHEIAHATLRHRAVREPRRSRQEQDAWRLARSLALALGVDVDQTYIDAEFGRAA